MSVTWHRDDTPTFSDGRQYSYWQYPPITARSPRRDWLRRATRIADQAFAGSLAGTIFYLTVWGITCLG